MTITDLIDLSDVQRISENVRRFQLDMGDTADLAKHFEVGQRAVQRMFTLGAQRRNLMTRAMIGETIVSLPPRLSERVIVGAAMTEGVTQAQRGVGEKKMYHVRASTLAKAGEYIRALATGGQDPYLVKAWTRATVQREGQGWLIEVEYVRLAEGESV